MSIGRIASTKAWLAFLLLKGADARTWRDIQTFHVISPLDLENIEPLEISPLDFTEMPSMAPTGQPTKNPTATPTKSSAPTVAVPTTSSPSAHPTKAPTTSHPTATATIDPFPENQTPRFPDPFYFNYETQQSAQYGPGYPALVRSDDGFIVEYQNNGWSNWRPPTNDWYWDEFGSNGFGAWNGVLANRRLNQNKCSTGGAQSPIDVRLSGVACVEHHQIRTRVSTVLQNLERKTYARNGCSF
jgi:endonuclease YncB( thermonuclease family)